MNIEQELADISYKVAADYYGDISLTVKSVHVEIAKEILSSGLVIPIDKLDGMVKKVAEAINGEEYGFENWIAEAKAAINAIKEEAREK